MRRQELLQGQGRLRHEEVAFHFRIQSGRKRWERIRPLSFQGKPMRLALLAFCISTTLATAADYRITGNIRYNREYPETVLDIVQSPAPAMTNHPGAIVIHGGGWIGGAKEDMLERFC